MFNIGGILSGIGDVADTTVRQGRRNKHDIEQINLRDKLARERQKEQFKMSRQEKFLARKEARKDRAKTLQLLGVTNPATIAYLSESDSTLQMVQDLRNNLDKKSLDLMLRKIRTHFFDVRYLPEKKFLISDKIDIQDFNINEINTILNRKQIDFRKIKKLSKKIF